MTMPIVVRPMVNASELERQFYLSDIAFSENPSVDNAAFWQKYVTTLPYHHPERIRGAFQGKKMVGGYELFERILHMGEARLVTGCIGSVNTDPEYRNQGVASALMHDAINYAREHHYALLLLDGIPKFYYRFGYTDIFDVTSQEVDRAAILAQSPSSYSVRLATLEDDAQRILSLYERQHYPYTASFTRTLEIQQHTLRHRSTENPYLLAYDGNGNVHGFLSLRKEPQRHIADEILADDWQATLALLQYHAHQLDGHDTPATLRYRLPVNHPLVYWMIAHLQVPDTNNQRDPNAFGAVLSLTFHHRHTGWMARIIDVQTLVREVLPAWQARWQRSLASWSGTLAFAIDGEPFHLDIHGTQISISIPEEETSQVLHFSQQAFTQLLFGYRPIAWFLEEDETTVPLDVLSVLTILFPTEHAFITRSDDF